ncbi:polyprenyl synthetase family protein [Nocardia pseudobrasiliensis]|uniref:polyprenyl synthetase family protein n=1 Tax=Nocardia pseudobrasiliensis TaxID=45979 RepID=UPI000A481ACB|nr:polyprenyl synthetase family protein [Nocardia pseudobrasiliensis]
MAAYHLGWRDLEGNPTDAGWGKGLRAALVFAAARACGTGRRAVVPAAVAVELVHNFPLVHDDVMDAARLRRGRATVWTVWGVPQAICLGGALHALAVRVVTRCGRCRGDGAECAECAVCGGGPGDHRSVRGVRPRTRAGVPTGRRHPRNLGRPGDDR